MIYTTTINDLPLTTGDVVCTINGVPFELAGVMWRLLGKIVPGEVDHCAIYVGPGQRFIESGALGVITFDMPGSTWEASAINGQRFLLDRIVGVAYPLANQQLSPTAEHTLREQVVTFALAQIGKPYNVNFLDVEQTKAFYCSQLIYRAYRECGIDLNTNRGVTAPKGLEQIIFPQEIWESCKHQRVATSILETLRN
jgi:cell wall-associated NlpC family hydrolase